MSETTPTTPEPARPSASADGYLWDRSAPVDAEVAALERALEPLRLSAGFAGVQQVTAARRMVGVRRWSLAVAAMVVIGAAVGWWWTGRPVTDSGELSPWKFVAGRGVRVHRQTNDRWSTTVTIRVGRGTGLELNGSHGGRVVLGRNSVVSFVEYDQSHAQSNDGLAIKSGPAEIYASSSRSLSGVTFERLDFEFTAGAVGRIDDDGAAIRQLTLLAGECRVHGRWWKANSNERMIAPMVYDCVQTVAPRRTDASPDLIAALGAYAKPQGKDWEEKEKSAAEALDLALRASRAEDLPTLWNIAFEMHPGEQLEQKTVKRIGELAGRWPAAIKMSKEPFWSWQFREDWWQIIKESTTGDAKLGKDDDEAMKKKAEEAKDVEAEKAAKEKDELDKKAAPRGKESAPPSRGKGGK